MMRKSAIAFVAFALLSGCAGTRTLKLAKCVGPYRYANPYGTVLPSLPISGRPIPALTTTPVAAPPSASPPPTPPAIAPVEPPAPAKSSAIPPHFPSC